MRKGLLMWVLVMGMSAALLSGCGKNSDSNNNPGKETSVSEEKSAEEREQEELLGWLREASDQLAQETIWGTKEQTVTIDENGKKDVTKTTITVDQQKQVVMMKAQFSTNDQIDFYTKEGDKEYNYYKVSTLNEKKQEYVDKYVKILQDETEGEYSYYTSRYLPHFLFENSDRVEFVDYKLTNEGEEDGAIKIKLEVDKKLMLIPSFTRESVIEEYSWTEDQIKLIDGASEVLDAYVKENDANIESNKDKVYKNIVWYWITKDDHKLVKSESQDIYPVEETKAKDKFYEISTKVDYLKDSLDAGVAQDEAVKLANEMEIDSAPWPKITDSKTTVEYVSGEDCVPLERIPEDAKEITYEQYMNGEY